MRHLQSNPTARRSWVTKGLALAALVLLTALPAQIVKADIRVHARVSTPNLELRVGHPGHRHVGKCVDVKRSYVRVSTYDHRIAMRMARMSGVPKGKLLKMHRRGMSWQRIGWRIGLNGREIKLAVSGRYHRERIRHPLVHTTGCRWP